MRVPLLDLSEQYRTLREPIREQIEDVLATQSFILGPKVEEFERAMERYCGVEHAIGISSGTDALLALLMALDFGPGDAVLTTAYTFFATGSCVARLGARPVFVDIDPASYNISPAAVERYIAEHCRTDANGRLIDRSGARIRAIMPVHLFGMCCDMDAISAIAEQHRLMILEDAAQAIGAEYPGSNGAPARQAGTMGLAGCFSFYPSKNLGAAGDAGMIICHDDALADRLRVCRQHGMEPRYFHHFIGGNFRLDGLQGAILKVKLPHLNGWSAARRTVADRYQELFTASGLTGRIQMPVEPYRGAGLTNHHIYHQYVIRTPRRDELQKHLTEQGIGTAIYYPLGLHEQKCFEYLGYKRGDLPETERAAAETLALPIYPELSADAQQYVVEQIAGFFA